MVVGRTSALIPVLFLLAFLPLSSLTGGCNSGANDDAANDNSALIADDDAMTDDDSVDDTADDAATDDDSYEPGSEFVVMAPMRDGVRLRTKVFLPDDIADAGAAAMMTRTPYRSAGSNAEYEKRARFFADRGYAFVLQDCRGRNESEGDFHPYEDENADAIDTSEWIAGQPWANGRVGTIGASYDAYTALIAAADNPYIVVVLAEDPPDNESGPHKNNGAVSKGRLEWLHTMKYGSWMSDGQITTASNLLDVANADFVIVGDHDPSWAELVGRPDPADPGWSDHAMSPYYEKICAPVLTIQEMELQWADPIANWKGIRAHGCPDALADVRLIVAPEKHEFHTIMLPYLETPPNKLMLQYADKFLGLQDIDVLTVPSVMYKSADDLWYRPSNTWPPPVTETVYHLDRKSGAGYLRNGAPVSPFTETITVDPATTDPCADTYPKLLFTSDILASGTYIAGTPTADIWVSTTTPDADVYLDLMEYPILGFPRLIACAQARLRYRSGGDELLSPGEIVHLSLDMFPVAFTVRTAARIALEVRPAHCGFFENPHTGEELGAQTHWASSTLTIYHNPAHPSLITLPIKN